MDPIQSIEAIPIRIPRDTPYLGALENGVATSDKGYFVRPGNRSVYSVYDQSVLVKATSRDGVVGWGECVAFVVPQANTAIINEMLGPFVQGRDPSDAAAIYHDMYDLMRVRGFFGGYYHDAVSAVDIAIWDLYGKQTGLPLCKLLGGRRHETLPCYVSGLPRPTLDQRIELALEWQARGFNAVKFASAVSHEGTAEEMARLREALGPAATILCDMHWKHTAPEAIKLIDQMDEHNLAVAEAPCQPEDLEGQAQVAAAVRCPVGIGEELRTVYEFRPRFEHRCMGVIQPEMGRTGVTSFMEICAMGRAFHTRAMPHGSIGIGIFLAASLHASATLPCLSLHEYQHSIVDKNQKYLAEPIPIGAGAMHVPEGAGHGCRPVDDIEKYRIDG